MGVGASPSEVLMGRTEIFDHEVERGIAGHHLALRKQDQVRSPAQLKHGHIRPLMHRPHPDRAHELGGLFHPIRLEYDVCYPDWRPHHLRVIS